MSAPLRTAHEQALHKSQVSVQEVSVDSANATSSAAKVLQFAAFDSEGNNSDDEDVQ